MANVGLFAKNVLFSLLVPGAVAFAVPYWIAGSRNFASGPIALVGFGMLLFGVAGYLWCVWDFGVTGRGTPAPIDAPTILVVRGLYRYTRNPMYVSVLIAIAGWTAVYTSRDLAIYLVVVAVFFHLFVILYEEPHLAAAFGADYDAYRSRVRRWLPIPRG